MSRSLCIVVESLGSGGAQHVAAALANAWAERGIDVTVVTMQTPETDVFTLDNRLRRIVIGGTGNSAHALAGLWANLRRLMRLRAALTSCKADLVIGFIGSTNVLTVLAAAGLGRRVVICERNDPALQSLGRPWDLLRRLVYRFADQVIANSRAALKTMEAYVPRERLQWLPNPLREPPSAASVPVAASDPTFLAVGRLTGQKAYDVLLTAFADVTRVVPRSRLVILGDGPLRSDLEKLAERIGISGAVSFAGFVADPFPWYRAAIALIHPARYEGLPNAVLEAMSQGLPVVIADAQVGLREYVRDGETGLIVSTGSASALAAAMLRLTNDAALRGRLGIAARAAIEPCRPDQAIAAWTTALRVEAPGLR